MDVGSVGLGLSTGAVSNSADVGPTGCERPVANAGDVGSVGFVSLTLPLALRPTGAASGFGSVGSGFVGFGFASFDWTGFAPTDAGPAGFAPEDFVAGVFALGVFALGIFASAFFVLGVFDAGVFGPDDVDLRPAGARSDATDNAPTDFFPATADGTNFGADFASLGFDPDSVALVFGVGGRDSASGSFVSASGAVAASSLWGAAPCLSAVFAFHLRITAEPQPTMPPHPDAPVTRSSAG